MIARALAVALAGALVLAAWQTHRLEAERARHAATRAAHAEQIASLETAARQAEAAARTEEQRRTAEVQKAADEANQALDRARADAVAAADAGQRLRQHLATLAAACRGPSGHPAAAGAGPSAGSTADLFAYVQRRLDEAADGIARHADQAHAAGRACERSYDALR